MNTIDLNSVALPSEDEQATNELGDCFDDFNIDFFAHLNNSTELIIRKDNTNNNSMLHYHNKLRAIQKKHNSTKEIHAQETTTSSSLSNHLLLNIDINQFLTAIQTHKGSLCLQIYLSSFPQALMNTFLEKISPILVDIMCSHYGNYFFQKLLQRLTLHQRVYIFNLIKHQMINISTHQSGTYSIQALIGELRTEKEKEQLMTILAPYYQLLLTNENAYHIMLKLIIDYPEHKRISLNQFIINNIYALVQNEYAYICVNKFISFNTNLNIRASIIQELSHNFVNLISCNNGCNIVLLVVEKFGGEYINFIYTEMMNHLPYFIQTTMSNVDAIEKLLINMHKYNPSKFINMIWKLIQNEYMNTLFFAYSNGVIIISILLQFALPEQRQYFLLKNKHVIQRSLVLSQTFFSYGI